MVGIDCLHVISSDCYLDCRALSFWASFNFGFFYFYVSADPNRPASRKEHGWVKCLFAFFSWRV